MNVLLSITLVAEVIAVITRAGAAASWSPKYRRWNEHSSGPDDSCSTGKCVKAWECPSDFVSETHSDSCYRRNGPWVCCALRGSTDDYKHNNGHGGAPCVEDLWFRNINKKPSHVYPLGDILKNTRGQHPSRNVQNKTTQSPQLSSQSAKHPTQAATKVQWGYTTRSNERTIFASKTTKMAYPLKPTKFVTDSASTVDKTHHVWGKYSTARPFTDSVTKKPTTIKRLGSTLSTKTTKKYLGTTKQPQPTKSTQSLPNRPSSEERGLQDWGKPTTVRPTKSQITRFTSPKSPSATQSTRSTRRYLVTTPLPNVNAYMCGIRDQRTIVRRQQRNGSYRTNPIFRGAATHMNSGTPFQRIVGGKEAEPFSWPWVAALYKVTTSGGNRFLSAGSLINGNFILTAAHVFSRDDLRSAFYVVMLGTHDAQDAVAEYTVSSVLLHPRYDHRYYYNDIALLRLRRGVAFNNYVMPVCLPSPAAPLLKDKDLQGKNATVMGWGDDSFGGKSSRVLKEATFPIVSRTSCNASYVRVASNRFPKGITNNMLCAGDPNGGKDACQGDSGGPLTVMENGRYTQVGIVSFGYKCGDKEFPGVYTKVAPYLSWIAENTRKQLNRDYFGHDY